MENNVVILIVFISALGGLAGFAALITAISKKKVDEVSVSEMVERIYGDIIQTLQVEAIGFKSKIKELEETIKEILREKEDVRCDRKGCKNRIPPK
jgi:hypothetical protein